MPVASIYRSTHLEMQLLSLPPRLEPGFVIHFSKHFLPTVCKINGDVEDEYNCGNQKTLNNRVLKFTKIIAHRN